MQEVLSVCSQVSVGCCNYQRIHTVQDRKPRHKVHYFDLSGCAEQGVDWGLLYKTQAGPKLQPDTAVAFATLPIEGDGFQWEVQAW